MPDLQLVRDAAVQEFLTTELANTFSPFSASTKPRLNVTAISVATKWKRGKDTGEPCIRFYVERKVPQPAIPSESVLPATYQGVPTDVIESGRFVASAAVLPGLLGPVTGRFRPIQPGSSCGFQFPPPNDSTIMAGTLGSLVQRNGKVFVLSNNHVLANENSLPLGSPIFQPGLLDGGDPLADRVASLSQFVRLNATGPNQVDCAIAEVTEGIAVDPEFLPQVGKLKSATPIAAVKNMAVEKVGRTSAYTQGTVTDVGVSVTVQYSFGAALFTNQMFISGSTGSFSAAGDSGSLIVDRQTKQGTGLLFAGSPQFTVANPLDAVLSALQVTLKV